MSNTQICVGVQAKASVPRNPQMESSSLRIDEDSCFADTLQCCKPQPTRIMEEPDHVT